MMKTYMHSSRDGYDETILGAELDGPNVATDLSPERYEIATSIVDTLKPSDAESLLNSAKLRGPVGSILQDPRPGPLGETSNVGRKLGAVQDTPGDPLEYPMTRRNVHGAMGTNP